MLSFNLKAVLLAVVVHFERIEIMSEASAPPKDRVRSPQYPIVDLESAVEKIRTLYKEDKGAAATMSVIAAHWESSEKSSGFMQTVATLRRYGLLEDAPNRQVKPTKLAIDIILLPVDDPRRATAIKTAALLPKIHHILWKEYGTNLPSDANLIHALVQTHQFKHDAAKDVVRVYKNTLAFAKLSEGDKMREVLADEASEDGGKSRHNMELEKMLGLTKPNILSAGGSQGTPTKDSDQSPRLRDFKIPLVDSPDAVLFVPTRLSEENFMLLKAMLTMFLDTAKKALVKDAESEKV